VEFNQVDQGRAVRATERFGEQYGLPKGSFGRLVASTSTTVSRNQPASLLEHFSVTGHRIVRRDSRIDGFEADRS
jgi:hypothetical protein